MSAPEDQIFTAIIDAYRARQTRHSPAAPAN
jgi:hypothetical protein